MPFYRLRLFFGGQSCHLQNAKKEIEKEADKLSIIRHIDKILKKSYDGRPDYIREMRGQLISETYCSILSYWKV